MSRKNVLVLSTKIMSIVTATCAVCISQSVSAETNANTNDSEKINRSVLIDSKNKQRENKQKEDKTKEDKQKENKQPDKDKPKDKDKPNTNVPVKKMAELRVTFQWGGLGDNGTLIKEDSDFGKLSQNWFSGEASPDIKEAFSKLKFKVVDETGKSQEVGCKFVPTLSSTTMSLGEFDAGHTYTISAVNETVPSPYFVRYDNVAISEDNQFKGDVGEFTWDPTNGTKTQYTKALNLDALEIIYAKDESVANKCFSYTQPKDAKGEWISKGDWQFKYNNDNIFARIRIKNNTISFPKENPTKDGYVFDSWQFYTVPVPLEMPNQPYTSQWGLGQNIPISSLKDYPTKYSPFDKPWTDYLYMFETIRDNKGVNNFEDKCGIQYGLISRTFVVFPKWRQFAKVTFKDGDKAYAIVEARVNKSINGDDLKDQSMPADPKKDGYKFTGWVDGNGNAFTGDTVVTGDMTVFSKYEEIVKPQPIAKVTFKDGDKAYAIVEARVNKSINGDDLKDQSMPADPKKDGYKFTGWVDGTGKAFTGDTVVTGDMTVFSKYEEIVKPQPIAKVTFKDGDKAYAIVEARVNKSINGDDLTDQSMPADPKKDGYKFTGWVDSAGKAFTGDTVVAGDMTVFSKYEEIVKPQPIAKVTFKDGDKAYAIVEARVNKSINGDDLKDQSMPADPKKDGYKFTGWVDSAGKAFTGDTVVTGDMTVFSKYEEIVKPQPIAKVTFKDGDKAYAIVEARVNKSINGDDLKDQSMPADPKKDGYKFTGWVDSAGKAFTGDTVVAGDMTVFSKYEEIVKPQPIAKVTFKDGDKAYAIVEARVNKSINGDDLKDQSMPADPKKDGYKFTGWVDGNGKAFTGDTVVTGDMTVFSKYEEIVKPQPKVEPKPEIENEPIPEYKPEDHSQESKTHDEVSEDIKNIIPEVTKKQVKTTKQLPQTGHNLVLGALISILSFGLAGWLISNKKKRD
ncbi:InlB B-repeat-containing protein [Lactobacillus iners]|uniref:InlB B-repeat-containing protein n=1 Tax=Lactobacillus iners TaxID=147802 RepID=UPI0029C5EEA8|nr:InlB B-repeat-containing protein [Lactobacillus iners]MDX5070354.1 InlB B-repeat-containing protein [Lactobacillus iners]MDX5084186.1 InlB B-repeat-containing protein [Lactobacillus iners]MDX5095718.1 InlB B-repeat-containing protein [Lactobacillus iners]